MLQGFKEFISRGNAIDLAFVARFAKKHGLLLIVDAAQTAGACPIPVQKLGIDVLCFTGHKGLLGPQGTGGLYVRPGLRAAPLVVGGSGVHSFDERHPAEMPTALEAGTLNVPGMHNVKNALAATAAAICLGVRPNAVKYGLAGFNGAGRRFEFKGKYNGADIYDEYAHHPGELKALILIGAIFVVGAIGMRAIFGAKEPTQEQKSEQPNQPEDASSASQEEKHAEN